uniref:Putative conserved plasma membrane protein n=1 Tax=Ixodes ricinus TaxID=34613 RepID=A0A131XUF3_IXORI
MKYRSWCLLVAAVLSTLATANCASLDDAALRLKDLTSNGGLAASDSIHGLAQHAGEKEFRNYTSEHREMICKPLEGGGVHCEYTETTSNFSLSWTPGAIAGLVVGLIALLVCVTVCCVFGCRGVCGRKNTPHTTVAYQTPHQVTMGPATHSFPQGAYPKQ